jgi:GTPase SAR1 family protein
MDTQQRQIPNIQFRVLIVGRANAGKTSILQRVCETTESPVIYRGQARWGEEVKLDPSMDRGEHSIHDELVFSNHEGYVFHDSQGIESGSTDELLILQGFIQGKCKERRLRDRLHAIWYCIPMDNQRPQLDLKFYKDICPDRNVPVIAVFTKYDQFLHNVEMHLVDYPNEYCPGITVSEAAEKQFQEHYLHPLGDAVRYVRLEKMHRQNTHCHDLIKKTAAGLNDDTVALMLLAVQRGNLELSVKSVLIHLYSGTVLKVTAVKDLVRECLRPFPYIWFFGVRSEWLPCLTAF